MKKYKLLVLTDHLTHSSENSIYPLLKEMIKNRSCQTIDVASRSTKVNHSFFNENKSFKLYVLNVTKTFSFQKTGKQFTENLRESNLNDYDFIFMRIPHPISKNFVKFLTKNFPINRIVNNPFGILETGSKSFLLNFREYSVPMKLCKNLNDLKIFSKKFPIVLKPLYSHGGKGIIKIENNDFSNNLLKKITSPILAMKFLRNVVQGDKRINVVNGKIVGATLRVPKKNSWLCNVNQGATAQKTDITLEEKRIVKVINENLVKKGIIIYGLDTLVDDYGKRVLSEINAASIGGFGQAEVLSKKPVIKLTSNLLWKHFTLMD